uniref:Uncharacterized protein LOC100379025 n=2 Tax=Saccoglossus kowalevskii TaxID=10224 RepID=A0ABM0MJX9_SACKO|nr:PREDICTED: uncharacterized protein LOC100379025 [Saccoglossus kowalevskii]
MPAGKIKVPDFVPQPLLKQHDASVLDLAFVMDCTGSMSSWITEAKQSIQSIVDEIVAKEMSDIRLALVEYRDHPPQDRSFVTRVLDFTPSLKEMQKKMNGMSASGASTSTSRKRKLSTIRSPSPAKKVARTIATAKRRVISIDKDCTQTRSRSVCPRTGICTVCHPTSTSLSSGRGKKRTSLPVTMPIPTTARGKRRAHGTKSPVKTPSVRVSASTSTTPSGDVDLAIGKAVSRKQVRRLVKKSIAVNKLRKM